MYRFFKSVMYVLCCLDTVHRRPNEFQSRNGYIPWSQTSIRDFFFQNGEKEKKRMLQTTFEKTVVSLLTVAVALLIVITSLLSFTWYVAVYIPIRSEMRRKKQYLAKQKDLPTR
jgi:hypothetical protein